MNRTEYLYFKGKAAWARVHQPDLKYKNWSIQVHLDRDSLALWNKIKQKEGETDGIMNELKRDEDGDYAIFRRPTHKNFGGRETALSTPLVLDKDNKLTATPIGNGSDVTVKIERYWYNKRGGGRGTAIRLAAVRVDNLVPYEQDSFTADETRAYAGIPDVTTVHKEDF